MNIFKWIMGRAGKVALSAVQAVGLTAVVGVAGIAAWQYLDAPAETNNTFTPVAYDAGDVVYVAGANTGSYGGGSYAGGGESQSSMQISANTLKRLERQEMSQRAAEEMAEYAPEQKVSSSVPGQAYQMGGTEGLGTGANIANEFALSNDPMAAMQQSMAGLPNMVSHAQAQVQTQQQAQGVATGKQEGGATLASASKNWGASGAGAGSSSGSAFAVQDSGKNRKGKGSSGEVNPQGLLASAQAQMAQVTEGARLRAQSSFGQSENIGGNYDAAIEGFKNSKAGKDLKYIHKRSNDASKNMARSANEGSRAFLSSTKISGGMMISSENVTTGQGQGSKDFESDTQSQLRGIKTWGVDTEIDANKRKKDRDDLRKWIWIAIPSALAIIPWIGAFADVARSMAGIPIVGGMLFAIFMGIAIALMLAVLALNLTLLIKSALYAKNYEGSSLSTWGMLLGGILAVAAPCALIPGVSKLLSSMKLWMALVAPVVGLGASWLTTGLTKNAALDDPASLLNSEIDANQGGTK